MDLREALRTTGAVRDFRPDPVPATTVAAILDDARFAPNGGNRQPWRVVDLRDPEIRRRMRDLYIEGWLEYLTLRQSGLTPFAPTNDDDHEGRLLAQGPQPDPGPFALGLDRVPVLLAILADLRVLAAVDKHLPRYSFAGGASVYPFVQNVLLAARLHGLGGVLTTIHQRREPEALALLGAPPHLGLAAVLALGVPVEDPRRLRRATVGEFATVDRLDGPPLVAGETPA